MPHLYTFTANLLWEQTFWMREWQPGRTSRAGSTSTQVGGKGINVAKMLARLEAPHTALCFPGGGVGQLVEQWLQANRFSYRAFASLSPETRTGLVVRTPRTSETTFLGPDTAVPPAAIRACAAELASAPADSVLAICGSIPGWEGPTGAAIRELCAAWKGPLVADTYGAPLQWLVEQPLALVKINREEFDRLAPAGSKQESALEFSMRLTETAASWPVKTWIVSDGGRPAWLFGKDRAPVPLAPPRVREISPTGSGDVLLAALLHAHFVSGHDWPAALGFALPLAAVNASHEGIAEFPMNKAPAPGSV